MSRSEGGRTRTDTQGLWLATRDVAHGTAATKYGVTYTMVTSIRRRRSHETVTRGLTPPLRSRALRQETLQEMYTNLLVILDHFRRLLHLTLFLGLVR